MRLEREAQHTSQVFCFENLNLAFLCFIWRQKQHSSGGSSNSSISSSKKGLRPDVVVESFGTVVAAFAIRQMFSRPVVLSQFLFCLFGSPPVDSFFRAPLGETFETRDTWKTSTIILIAIEQGNIEKSKSRETIESKLRTHNENNGSTGSILSSPPPPHANLVLPVAPPKHLLIEKHYYSGKMVCQGRQVSTHYEYS